MAPFRKYKRKLKVSKDVKKYVKNAVEDEPELKRFQSSQGPVSYSTSGLVQSLGGSMARGADVNQRIGDMIKYKRFKINLAFQGNSVAYSDQTVRVIIFRDMNNVGTGITSPLSILQVLHPLSQINQDTMTNKRLDILYDKLVVISNPLENKDSSTVVLRKTINKTCKAQWQYNGTYGQGQLYIFFITDTTADTSAGNAGAGVFRYFYDIDYTDA